MNSIRFLHYTEVHLWIFLILLPSEGIRKDSSTEWDIRLNRVIIFSGNSVFSVEGFFLMTSRIFILLLHLLFLFKTKQNKKPQILWKFCLKYTASALWSWIWVFTEHNQITNKSHGKEPESPLAIISGHTKSAKHSRIVPLLRKKKKNLVNSFTGY